MNTRMDFVQSTCPTPRSPGVHLGPIVVQSNSGRRRLRRPSPAPKRTPTSAKRRRNRTFPVPTGTHVSLHGGQRRTTEIEMWTQLSLDSTRPSNWSTV